MIKFLKLLPITISLLVATIIAEASTQAEFNEAYDAAQAGDYKRAIALWTPLAEKGEASAQYTLGWMFESGQGVKKNYQQAEFWYTKAAKQGDVAAQYVLATLHAKGSGLPLNNLEAVHWFTEAANQGDAAAQYKLGEHFRNGLGVKQNYKESLIYFTKAAEQGHIASQIIIGKIYQSGIGDKQNYKKAIRWYKKAAEQNNGLGLYHLAYMYEYGNGVPQNFTKAKALYLQSLNSQHAPSAYKLAEFYEHGKGVSVDFKEAYKWYNVSARKGNSDAQFKLGNLYKEGKGVERNIRTAIEWYIQASNLDHAPSHYQLGVIYEAGTLEKENNQSTNINYKKVLKHFQQASDLGYPEAHARLAYLYENSLGAEVDLIKAVSLYKKSPQPWAIERYQLLSKHLECFKTATTKLFSIDIACTTRQKLRDKIVEQGITAIDENNDNWSDTYFTAAVIPGSSELQITYTRENFFVSAQYTFVGRNNPELIEQVKNKLVSKYGLPMKQSGQIEHGPASFSWILSDNIKLTVSRAWPDTTTYILYLAPEKKLLQEAQQAQSNDKKFIPRDQRTDITIESDFF